MSGDEIGKLRRVCDVCGGKLSHPEGAGRPRRYCDDDCARDAQLERKRREREELKAVAHG